MRQRYPEVDVEYFFTDTGKELPEVYTYLTRLEGYLGKSILRLNPDRDFDYWLKSYKSYLPSAQSRWCTRQLKLRPFERWVRQFMEAGETVISYVAIRSDEEYREGYQSNKEAKQYEKNAIEHGSPFTWSQGESLSELEKPERQEQIRVEHERRVERARARIQANPLRPEASIDLDDVYGGVTARTILELGSELISSDAIAFYELIKNGIDAGSNNGVTVSFNIVLGRRDYQESKSQILSAIEDEDAVELDDLKVELSGKLNTEADELWDEACALIDEAETLDALLQALEEIDALNSITISDTGSGMSLTDLDTVFLVIGTSSRKSEIDAAIAGGKSRAPFLGEKGIGRLSAMRLGDRLSVRTTQTNDKNFNLIDIDWSKFDDASKMIEDIDIKPRRGEKKDDPDFSGTDIKIEKLNADWSDKRVERLAMDDFSLLVDPLAKASGQRIAVYWNGKRVNFRRLENSFSSAGERQALLNLLDQWMGVRLYRDGFRVYPYGAEDDDWLDLDKTALASKGYALNRIQLIGQIEIGRLQNPELIDQTNREGLRQTPEEAILKETVQFAVERLRDEMNRVTKEQKDAKEPFIADETKTADLEKRMKTAIQSIRKVVPSEHRDVVQELELMREEFARYAAQARERIADMEKDADQMLAMAGIGLMVEVVAHELTRSAEDALDVLNGLKRKSVPDEIRRRLESLRASMTSISKRLRILDPLSVTGRQRKERFNLDELLNEILEAHEAQFERHQVELDVVLPDRSVQVSAVKGMVVQVLENLISNSIYWMDVEKQRKMSFRPELTISLEDNPPRIRFSDNGPGISKQYKDRVFDLFFSLKDKSRRRGLGLYIAREAAEHNGGDLILDPDILNEVRDAGIGSAIIVDDGYDEIPEVAELLDEGAWDSFFDDAQGVEAERITAHFPAYDPEEREELRSNQEFINALWEVAPAEGAREVP
ncbi:Sensor histidine kinase YycG [Symbiodinium microadriaticum]|uniref:histidine kinase n=1 Tax=Symbiodinium microadriaticum TaxID=2951 RepID=A0A1Q9C0V8_SYMMI|nr:Sensor histidine kinase YycG [Symbiodinium microadriaticum]